MSGVTTRRISDIHAWLRATGIRRMSPEEALAAFAVSAIESEARYDHLDVAADWEAGR